MERKPECAECGKDLARLLAKSVVREKPLVAQNLPEPYPNAPNVTIPIQTLKEFRQNYTEVAEFAAWICGVPLEKFNKLDMLTAVMQKIKTQRDQMAEQQGAS